MTDRPGLSKGEMEVARVLWQLGQATVRQVHEAFPPEREIDFTTVQTYLRRLEQKGYVTGKLKARARVYAPKVKPRTVIRETIDDLVDRLFGGDALPLMRRQRRVRPPPLVVLCDVSGSMGQYSRMLLHFLHALTNDRDRVQVFLFGTRLTNVTRQLRFRDPDEALAKVAEAVQDWDGGTRIGPCLAAFNRDWARRVLAQGAVVLLITDGLDRAGAEGLTQEMERLHKSCRRLIWLNPLLRYEGYAPKSQGARAMLPQVDEFRSVHNLASLSELAEALSQAPGQRRTARHGWSEEGRKA